MAPCFLAMGSTRVIAVPLSGPVETLRLVAQDVALSLENLPSTPSFTTARSEVFVESRKLRDVPAEIARHQRELEKLDQQIAAKQKKLANEQFVSRAPAAVVAQERAASPNSKRDERRPPRRSPSSSGLNHLSPRRHVGRASVEGHRDWLAGN